MTANKKSPDLGAPPDVPYVSPAMLKNGNLATIAKCILSIYPTAESAASVLLPLLENYGKELAAVRAGRDKLLNTVNDLQAENEAVSKCLVKTTATLHDQRLIITSYQREIKTLRAELARETAIVGEQQSLIKHLRAVKAQRFPALAINRSDGRLPGHRDTS